MNQKQTSDSKSKSNDFIAVVKVGDLKYRFHKKRIVIGSVTSADVRLLGDGIAPIHAVLEIDLEKKSGKIYDIASETGVFVNGAKTLTAEVVTKDSIAIGPIQISIEFEKENEGGIPEKIWKSGKEKLYGDPSEDLVPLLLESQSRVEEIFNYRPSAKRAVEIVMSWHETILNIEHFINKNKITIGSKAGCDFAIPPVSQGEKHSLIRFSGKGFILKKHPSMEGVVQSNGSVQNIDQMPSEIPFGVNDFAKISMGGVDFYISFTAAPPKLKRRRVTENDPLFRRFLVGSLAFTAFLLWILFRTEIPQTVEIEELPDRIATILYQPEKFTSYIQPKSKPRVKAKHESKRSEVKPKPKKKKPPKKIILDIKPNQQKRIKKIPKKINTGKRTAKKKLKTKRTSQAKTVKKRSIRQRAGNEGRGARAKGKTGKRGIPNAKRKGIPQRKASRPTSTGRGGDGRGARSRVKGPGNLSFLKGAGSRIQNLLGSATSGLGKSGKRLRGYGVFNTEGTNGLALSGTGTGGGGSAEGLGGLSNRGRGGGRVGTGLGALGKGGGIIGGKARVSIQAGGGEETVMMGAIDKAAVEAALLAHKDEFRLCYEREINSETPGLSGRVSTTFVIGPRGRVTRTGIRSSSLENVNVERCILKVIQRIQFPIPRGAGIVQVNYPFKFRALNR